MLKDLLIALMLGLVFGNGLPHLVRGITKERYPCKAGNGPVPNFFGGWASLAIIAAVLKLVDFDALGIGSLIAFFAGFFLTGIFHATIGSGGRKEEE